MQENYAIDGKETPWSTVGYLTYKRTYSRRLDPEDLNSETEEWEDTIDRCIQAAKDQLGCNMSEDEYGRLRYYMHQLKGTVAGRFLWQLGTPTIEKLGLPSLQNCAACVVDQPVRPFTWAMDRLMLGCGVGYNIQREYVYKLPPVLSTFKKPVRHDHKDADFVLPDTREGWVKLLEYTLRSAFYTEDKQGFSYSTQLIRGHGAPIKGFGGVASGPEILCEGIDQISDVLEKRKGKQLRPIDCLDIMNIIGSIVVAGNIRRSAQLAIGDPDDIQYLKAKNWSEGNIPNWRSYSNNSVACSNINHLPEEFWKTYEGGSEPYGLINLKLSRSCGRIGDTQYKDKGVVAYNPCAEQSLANYETCCLAEVFLPMIDSKEELIDVVKLLYKVNKHSLALPDTASKETQEIVNKNMRMGIGVTGYLQATEEQRSWLSDCYEELRKYDVEYSQIHDFPVSIKLTTCKPSGCRPASALVTTRQGVFCLDEIEPDGSAEWTEVSDLTCHAGNITKFYRNGVAPVYRVNMNYGMSVESTANHQWFVENKGWTRTDELDQNDRIVIEPGAYVSEEDVSLLPVAAGDARAVNISFPEKMNPDLSWLMGYLWGDGALSPIKKRIRFIDNNIDNLEKARGILRDQFGLESNILPASEGRKAWVLEKASSHLWDWLIINGFWKYREGGGLSRIPLPIRKSSTESLLAFMAGWFDADGHYKDGRAVFSTADEVFAKHAQDVAWSVGLAIGRSHNTKGSNLQETKSMWLMGISSNTTSDAWAMFSKHSNKATGPLRHTRVFRSGVVSSVEFIGLEETYDVETDEHWFYAGAVKSHNTLSLLPGVTPGVHPGYAQYMIRRISIASGHPLVQVCKDHGYPVEYRRKFDGTNDHSTVIVEFPFSFPEGTVLARDVTAIDQLEFVKRLQTEWSDNSVSCTVYYRKEELEDIKNYLKKNYDKNFKSLSFLLHSEHGFDQAPYEEIMKDEFDQRTQQSKLITRFTGELDMDTTEECESGMCPVR